MKQILLFAISLIALCAVAQNDSTVTILPQFSVGESHNYTITSTYHTGLEQRTSKMEGESRICLTVVDSTASYYEMEWKCTGFDQGQFNAEDGSPLDQFFKNMQRNFNEKMVGQSIRFRLSPQGEILEYLNTEQLKARAQEFYNETAQEMTEKFGFLKEMGIDVEKILSESINAHPDAITQQLKDILSFYGKTYKLGQSTTVEQDSLNGVAVEHTTVTRVNVDNGLVTVLTEKTTPLPREAVIALMKQYMAAYGMAEAFDNLEIKDDTVLNMFGEIKTVQSTQQTFTPTGWLKQMTVAKSEQTALTCNTTQVTILMTD